MPERIEPTVPSEIIARKIYLIRGHKVMLDRDLAELYQVETRALNQAVKRNLNRFPEDFMFQLTADEEEALRSQSVISNTGTGRGGRRYLPLVFTEQGVAMLSSVLKSDRAVQVNVAIMRVFVKIRTLVASHTDLLRRLDEMEEKYDARFRVVFEAIRDLMKPEPVPPKNRIGFIAPQNDEQE
jgi:ORF6N domain-containing protein